MGKKSKIRDIYKGNCMAVWDDGDCIFFSLPCFTFNISHGEDFNALLEDMDKFIHILRPHKDTGWIDNLLSTIKSE